METKMTRRELAQYTFFSFVKGVIKADASNAAKIMAIKDEINRIGGIEDK